MTKAIRVSQFEKDMECESPGCESRRVAAWSIEFGSGYRCACAQHAQELIDESVEAGDIYSNEPVECEVCSGQAEPIGALGNRLHYRCRACGADQSKEIS